MGGSRDIPLAETLKQSRRPFCALPLIPACVLFLAASCSATEFECRTDHLCIPVSRVSDGIRDCPDGSDECTDHQFRCRCGNPVCVDRARLMDGRIDCEDGSDEAPPDATTTHECISNELSPGKFRV